MPSSFSLLWTLNNQVSLTPHIALPLYILRHTSRHKDILPIFIHIHSPLHISYCPAFIADLNSRHGLMVTIHFSEMDRRRRRVGGSEIVRAALRRHCSLAAAVGGEEAGKEP